MKAPEYYVSDLLVTSPQRLPSICLDKFYTADNLSMIFKGVGKSYYANAIQYFCDDYSIMFSEL